MGGDLAYKSSVCVGFNTGQRYLGRGNIRQKPRTRLGHYFFHDVTQQLLLSAISHLQNRFCSRDVLNKRTLWLTS